jgi:hypothetical protein
MGRENGRNRRQRQKAHACKRAREWYDIRLTFEDIEGLNAVVRLGLGRSMERNSKKRGEKYFVTTLCGMQIPVVYDHQYGTIVTVLSPQAWEVRRAMAKRYMKSDSGSAKQYRVSGFVADLNDPGADARGVSASAPGTNLEANNGP